MPERDWLFFYAVGLILVCGLVFAGSVNHSQQRERHYQSAQEQYTGAYERITESSPVRQSLIADVEAYRQEWREEQDLAAQRDMAKWALFMMVASFFGVGVTAIGVVFVAKTLVATREAVAAANRTADEAKRIGEAQVRAYVAITSVTVVFIWDETRSNLYPVFRIYFGNSGASPATNYMMHIKLAYGGIGWNGTAIAEVHLAPENWGTIVAKAERMHIHRFPDTPLTKNEFNALRRGHGLAVHVTIKTSFKDVFGVTISDDHGFIHLYSTVDELHDQRPMIGSPERISDVPKYVWSGLNSGDE